MQSAERSIRVVLVISCVAFFAGCATWPVTTDYDPDAQFSELRTYAWLPDQPGQPRDPRLQNDLLDARVRASVERTLAERGFEKATQGAADFLVTYYISLETRIDVQTIHRNHRYSFRGGWVGGPTTETWVTEYERGTLLLDVLLPPERRLIWRGSTNARVRDRPTPEARAQRIDGAVQAIMKRFPPG